MHVIVDYIFQLLFLLGIVIASGCVFFFIEKIRPAEKDVPFFKNDMMNEFLLALSNAALFQPIITFLVRILVTVTIAQIIPYQIFDSAILSLPDPVQIVLAMIILDFSVYWRHRFSHFGLWSYHSVHHSAEHLTWMTKLRLHPVDVFAAVLFDTVILHVFGFSGQAIILASLFMMFFDFYAHSNLNLKFGKPLRYILVSPHYHRWHHANIRAAYDKNFCSMFPFLDLAFGTFYHPEDLPHVYGLSKAEQKDFPAESFAGWLIYPFKRDYKRLKNNKNL